LQHVLGRKGKREKGKGGKNGRGKVLFTQLQEKLEKKSGR
jgi:hypothetical protein